MKTYRCKYCGYKTQKETQPKICNYCSKPNSMSEVEDAEKILNEI